MNKRLVKWLVIGTVLSALVLFFAFHGLSFLSFANLKAEQAGLQDGYHHRPLLFLGAFAGAYVIAAALSLPGAALFTLAAGAIFGVTAGTAVALGSSAIGASLAFLSARYALRDTIEGSFRTRLEAINRGLARDGVFYLITLRLIAVIPFFVVNLAMGVTRIRLITFFLGSLVGMLPGALVYANAGTRLGALKSPGDILSVPVLAAFAALAVLPWAAKGALGWWRWRRTTGRFPAPAQFDFDLTVIGAGAAGLTAAAVAAQLGAKVMLIERERMGGECLNTGCVPSKALLREAHFLAEARRHAAGDPTFPVPVADLPAAMARVRAAIARLEPHDSRARFQGLGVTCASGAARLVSPYAVAVAGTTVTSRTILIATGGSPRLPDVPGFTGIEALTTETVWGLRSLPRRLVIIGGGPVGCELGQCFARFGSQVTIITAPYQLLEHEDLDVATILADRLRGDGIRLVLGEQLVRCTHQGTDKIVVSLGENGLSNHVCDEVLVALGKRPNTAALGLAELGVAIAKDGRIETDEFLRTNFPNIVACGDVSSKLLFTHVASDQAWRATANALLAPLSHQRPETKAVPWITFTEPEVGRVGFSEGEATTRGIPIEVTRYDLAENDRAVIDGRTGMLKVITGRGTDRILGAAVVGPGAAELIGELTGAIARGVGLKALATGMHAYPTYGDAVARVAAAWRRAHTPAWQLRALTHYLALRRAPARWRLCLGLAAVLMVVVVAGAWLGVSAVVARHAAAPAAVGDAQPPVPGDR
ncbi:MAG: FAD-dependent oxidoreductase [Planctomycetes bacterium]|nr:FAD-dependent oxidoreductase [Planctomycetota bacterium]